MFGNSGLAVAVLASFSAVCLSRRAPMLRLSRFLVKVSPR